MQTPQTFRSTEIRRAYQAPEQPLFTDCASVAEEAGQPIYLVEGSYRNIKITTPEDLLFVEALLGQKSKNPATGGVLPTDSGTLPADNGTS